jgi:CRISPR-associated protein Csb2
MSLVLEIEHLLGVAFAAQTPASDAPDWPPQPDRVFSALVAAWGGRGETHDERRALEWLERQPAPEIAASDGYPRTAPTVFVPPNDPQTRKIADRSVMPAFRRRQPRRFPAFRPEDPCVRLIWPQSVADDATLAALNALAADTPYLGHSSSLVRCRFRTGDILESMAKSRRWVYPGRLAELGSLYHSGARPSPGEAARAEPTVVPEAPGSVFSDQWRVLEHVDGEMPDLRAAAVVAKALHKTVMAGYERIGLGAEIPPAVSGHSMDGAPLGAPHLAFAPMAFFGSQYADGSVHGFALIPPRDPDLLADPSFHRAMRAIMPWSDERSRRELDLVGEGFRVVFALSNATARRSLDPTPYLAGGRLWATCTPIVLDRHLKETDNAAREAEIETLIRHACANIGLPEPERIIADKHSAVEGAPSAYRSGRSPSWTGWRLPRQIAGRQLTHTVLQFANPVRGPVILGAGRFVGLGLCRTLDRVRRSP